MPRQIADVAELRALLGQEVAVSDWLEVAQERINQFAEATGDHQWIHLDVARAQQESPYGTTIAHGFLTLSLLSTLLAQAFRLGGVKMSINYGLNKVRFTAPVPAGARIRARVTLQKLEDFSGGVQATWGVVIEREGAEKPVCVAEWLGRSYL